MKKILQKAGTLFLIFVGALVVYFISAKNTMGKEPTTYTSMEEPSLSVVYTQLGDQGINCLHGYMQDIGNQVAKEGISVLPEDRGLNIRIEEYGNTITDISYEVRNLTLDRLVERIEMEDWVSGDGGVSAVLPIRNLLVRDETHLLSVTVSTGEKELYHYARIIWPDNAYASDMVRLAQEFTRESLDYNQVRDLVSYLETNDTEDNSLLRHVIIRVSLNHPTWDGLDVKMAGEPLMTLREFDGIIGQVQIWYQVAINEENGTRSTVDAEDNFTMKWNEQRIYLMNYKRNANEVSDGGHQSFSGKKTLLRTTSDNKVRTTRSPESKHVAFKAGGNLWCYDYDDKQAVCAFSPRSSPDDGTRSNYDGHDIKTLPVQDDGSMDFLVYGYTNRGKYEGRMGMVYYHYGEEQDIVQEKFFLPAPRSYDMVKVNIDRLSYLSENDIMYTMLQGTVYGVDLKSNESLVVAQGLTEGSYAVSGNTSRFARQGGQNLYESKKVHVTDFNTSQKQKIVGEVNNYVRVLEFAGNDLIYGLNSPKDKWTVDGRMKGMPMYAMYTVDTQMQTESEYRKDGIYITDAVAQDGRIHLKRLVPLGENQYLYQGEGTIVCNQRIEEGPLEGIGWFTPQDKGKVYFVQVGLEIHGNEVRISAPKAFSYEYTSVLDIGTSASAPSNNSMVFEVHGGEHYLGSSRAFSQAVEMAYEQMGHVTDSSQRIVWDRIDRQPIRNIKSPVDETREVTKYLDSFDGSHAYEDGFILIDAGGCSLSQMLYYIDKGISVIAYMESGQYVLLSGYDQYSVMFYDSQAQETQRMGLNDATEYFKSLQNDFLCVLAME